MKKMSKVNKQELKDIVSRFTGVQIYIIGDTMVDEYWHSIVERFSPEAPVPISLVKKITKTLGGAANVASNIKSLGGKPTLISRVGDDIEGKYAYKMLKEISDNTKLVFEKSQITIKKIRVLVDNHHLLRIDHENTEPSVNTENEIISTLKTIPRNSILIVSDYNKGLVTEKVAQEISKLAKKNNLKVLVDPTPKTITKIKGPFLIKPNQKETETFLDEKIEDDLSNINKIIKNIKKKTDSKNILITLGKLGMILSEDNRIIHQKTVAKKIFDVSGAGDTVIATLALSLGAHSTLNEAMILSNISAGIVVSKLGTSTCSGQELLDEIEHYDN